MRRKFPPQFQTENKSTRKATKKYYFASKDVVNMKGIDEAMDNKKAFESSLGTCLQTNRGS